MSTTYPSKVITILDLPEPKNFKVVFDYNFFIKDETVNGEGYGFDFSQSTKTEIKNLDARIPRLVKLTWNPVKMINSTRKGRRKTNNKSRSTSANIFNLNNVRKIQRESSFSNYDFVSVNFQDDGLDNMLYNAVSSSIYLRNINEDEMTDAALELNSQTPDLINGSLLVKTLFSPERQGEVVINPKTGKQSKPPSFKALKKVSTHTQINNKFVSTLIRSVAADATSLYADEMKKLVKTADKVQKEAIRNHKPGTIDEGRWDSGFTPITSEPLSYVDASNEVSDIHGVGYIIDRDELDENGKVIHRKTILIRGLNACYAVDPEIKYGSVYRYQIRTVAVVALPGIDENENITLLRGLISSNDVKETVECVEKIAPPPVQDFKPIWDYAIGKLHLMWNFPVNSQRDIKYFQVFRRKSINEPFELLQTYDFYDGLGPPVLFEEIDEELIIKTADPILLYTDKEFTKDSDFIYAICSIDAHGYSSAYSVQTRVTFNRFKNKLELQEVSKSGAPKPYPNLNLNQETFVDVMKTSGFHRFNVFFHPEYLKLITSEGSDLKFLPLEDTGAVYKMQIVNIDLQANQIIDMYLEDRRTPIPVINKRRKKRVSKLKVSTLGGLRYAT